MPTTLETAPPIAALSVDVAVTGERKSLHRNVTVRVLRWAQAEKQIVSRPVLRYMKVLAALGILGSQLGHAETPSEKQNPTTAIDIAGLDERSLAVYCLETVRKSVPSR